MKLILNQDVTGLGAPGDVVELEVQGIGTLRNTVGTRSDVVPDESIIGRSTHA